MKIKSLVTTFGISSALIVSSVFLTNCTSKITEQQLAQLQELRREESRLTQEISKKKSEKDGLDREVSARQAEVKKCNDEMDFIKKKLSQWPNVWPDYSPEAEQPKE